MCNTQSRKAIINTLTIEAMIPTQPTQLLIQKGLKGTSPLRIRPHSNFYLCDKKKNKNCTQSNINFKAGSVHVLPAEAGPAGFSTEDGGSHRCTSEILWSVVFKKLQLFASSVFDSPESSWTGSHLPFASFKMSSRQQVFNESTIFWSQSQVGQSIR